MLAGERWVRHAGVLFDLDGTLLDVSAGIREGVAALHAEVGGGRSFDVMFDAWMTADKKFDPEIHPSADNTALRRARVREVFGQAVDDGAADVLFEIYRRAQERKWALFDDALPCLDALQGMAIGVVSNGDGAQQRAKLVKTGIAVRFRCIVVSAEVGASKPEASIFLEACRGLGCSPGDVYLVGDRYETDALGARRAGLKGVWLDRWQSCNGGHEPPMVSSLLDFAGLVRSSMP